MVPSPARWVFAKPDPAAVRAVADATGVRPAIAAALVNRGVAGADAARAFLAPTLASLHDPADLAGMDRAVARVSAALAGGERICIHGDFDADGMTATALLANVFDQLGHPVDVFVPDRRRDGYGLAADRIRELATSGVRLLIAVDCGTCSHAEIALAGSLGTDVVVLDHHEPDATLPDAVAVVNPRRADCRFPCKDLAAVGVAFFFAGALRRELIASGRLVAGALDLRSELDLVALGTVADVVPLLSDNRALVAAGLKRMNEAPRPGIAALKAVAGIANRTVGAGTVGFQLAPRLNASGRVSDARSGVELLRAHDAERAQYFAERLDRENRERQAIGAEVIAAAMAQVDAAGGPAHRAIVVAAEGWHPGVVGIAAARLVEAWRRPAIVLAIEDGVARGSCRGVRGFDIGQALETLSGMLLRHGGHPMAAGLSLRAERVAEFTAAFEALADAGVPDEALVPRVDVDAAIRLAEADAGLVAGMEALHPHGIGNPEPVFAAFGVRVREARVVGADRSHLQLTLEADGTTAGAIWFGGAAAAPTPGDVVDVAFSPGRDDRNGGVRLRVRDVRPAAPGDSCENGATP